MGTTAVYGWRYPASTDAPDGATQLQTLAQDIEATLAQYGLVLPQGPTSLTIGGGATVRSFASCRRLVTGLIEVKIDINITGTTQSDHVITTLPTYARPSQARSFPAYGSNGALTSSPALARFDIATDGTVKPQYINFTGSTFLGFTGVYMP